MKIRPATFGFALFAAVSVSFAMWSEWSHSVSIGAHAGPAESTRRVFADLGSLDLAKATLELVGSEGKAVRLVPAGDGRHLVMVGEVVLGPADQEYLEGAWASVRIANALRSVPRGTETEAGRHGAIRLSFPDRTLTLQLGRPSPDGVGVYAALKGNDGGTWVVEEELAKLVEQPPNSWIARRLLPFDIEVVSRIAFADGHSLARGDDGIWRKVATLPADEHEHASAAGELLSNPAVNLRLSRILGAGARVFVDRQDVDANLLRPWLTLSEREGISSHLMIGGPCPGEEHAVVVDRGPGLLPCIDEEITAPWPLAEPSAGFLETQLVPHSYSTVAEVAQTVPLVAHLRRRPGTWEMSTGSEASRYSVVVESEVFRWFERLRSFSLTTRAMPENARANFTPQFAATITFDSQQTVALVCGAVGDVTVCQRDGGPLYPVSATIDERIVLDFELLADRTLVYLPSESIRALEISGPNEAKVVRQSLRLEYGQWQLEAPAHPDGNNALDQTRLESLMAAIAGLRADRWLPSTKSPIERTFNLVHYPLPDRRTETNVVVFADCVAQVNGGRLAQIDASTCATLRSDLLFDDPLAYALREPRSVEIIGADFGESPVRFNRSGEGWEPLGADTRANERAIEELAKWSARRARRIVGGAPSSAAIAQVVVHRLQLGVSTFEIGPNWTSIAGSGWYYDQEER